MAFPFFISLSTSFYLVSVMTFLLQTFSTHNLPSSSTHHLKQQRKAFSAIIYLYQQNIFLQWKNKKPDTFSWSDLAACTTFTFHCFSLCACCANCEGEIKIKSWEFISHKNICFEIVDVSLFFQEKPEGWKGK